MMLKNEWIYILTAEEPVFVVNHSMCYKLFQKENQNDSLGKTVCLQVCKKVLLLQVFLYDK